MENNNISAEISLALANDEIKKILEKYNVSLVLNRCGTVGLLHMEVNKLLVFDNGDLLKNQMTVVELKPLINLIERKCSDVRF